MLVNSKYPDGLKHRILFKDPLDLFEGLLEVRQKMNIDGHPLGGGHHFIRPLGHGPRPDIDQVVPLEFPDPDADLLKLVFGKRHYCLIHDLSSADSVVGLDLSPR